MAIYQKYRPQTFAEVRGNDFVKKILLSSLKNGKLSHAYLFAGPRGTGKTTMARLIAKAVNCVDVLKDGDACGKCVVCQAVQNGKFMDLIEIDAASNRGIDEIRLLKEKVNFAPLEAKKKVYIIDEVHMLTREAFNALLKTIEEPPEFVIFILATTEPHKVPATIMSRVQRFDLKLATQAEIVGTLQYIAKSEGVDIDDAAATRVYELGGGSFRDSESILDKVFGIEVKKDHKITLAEVEEALGMVEGKVVQEFLDLLINGDAKALLEHLETIVNSGTSVDQFVSQLIIEIRKRIRLVYAGQNTASLRRLVEIAAALSEVSFKMKDAVITTLPLEIAIMRLSGEVIEPRAQYSAKESVEKKENAEDHTNTLVKTKPVTKEAKAEEKVEKPNSEMEKATERTQNTETVETEVATKEMPSKKTDSDAETPEAHIEETGGGTVSLDHIKTNWLEVIKKSKEFNHNLCAFLTSAVVKDVQDGKLTLEVAYKFHKQKIESVKAREFLHQLFKELFGANINVFCEVNPSLVKMSIEESADNASNENLVEEVFQDM